MRFAKSIMGYVLLGCFFFYAFFLWQFPYDRLKNTLIQNFEESLPLSLSIARIAPSLPMSMRFENIRVGREDFALQLPDLIVHPRLVETFLGTPAFEFSDGKKSPWVEGTFQRKKIGNKLDLRLNKMEIRTAFGNGEPLRIQASGEASFQWEGEELERGRGQLWGLLEREELPARAASQVPLPLTLFDTLRVEVQIQEGVARVRRLEASGKQTRFSLPQPIQVPLQGRALPAELLSLLQMAPR